MPSAVTSCFESYIIGSVSFLEGLLLVCFSLSQFLSHFCFLGVFFFFLLIFLSVVSWLALGQASEAGIRVTDMWYRDKDPFRDRWVRAKAGNSCDYSDVLIRKSCLTATLMGQTTSNSEEQSHWPSLCFHADIVVC